MYQNLENVNMLAISDLTDCQLNEVSGGGCPVAIGAAGLLTGLIISATAAILDSF